MFFDFLFGRSILPGEFERSVFRVVARHVTDKSAFREELAAIDNLGKIPLPEKRTKSAAELYLLLERNISEAQKRNRIPPEVLREEILNRCHPERAQGNFALFFLPHYERQIKLFEKFSDLVLARTRELLGPDRYGALIKTIEVDFFFPGAAKNGALLWRRIEKKMQNSTPPVRRDTLQNLLSRAFGLLTMRMNEVIGEMRTEMMFQEAYRKYFDPISFIGDAPKALLLVPETFLSEERIALMGKDELEKKLREKSKALETTLAEVQGEKLKLSELSRDELERKVQERTVELVSSLKATQEARNNLQEFSSLATHELRTPIAAIRGYLNLIANEKNAKLTDVQKKYIEQADRANERLLTLVNAMLNVSRIELGMLAVDPQPTYLPDIMDAVLADLAGRIEDNEQKVMKEYDRMVPIIDVDPSLVHAIFENLISNAVKYTPARGTITVAIQKQEVNAIIRVHDTGYGIPQAQQTRIFEKMFRADNARAKVAEGTGLGLYLVKSILDETGGKISFASEEGKGTTFTVTIPLLGMQKREGTKGLS